MSYIHDVHDAEETILGMKPDDLHNLRQSIEEAGEMHLRVRALELVIAAGFQNERVLPQADRYLAWLKGEGQP